MEVFFFGSERSREEEERPISQPVATQDEEAAEEEGEVEEGEEVEEEREGSELEEVWSQSPAPSPQPASHPAIIPNSLVHPGPQDQANKHGIYVYRE